MLLPASLCCWRALGHLTNHKEKLQWWKQDCVSLVRYGSDAVSSNGKGNGEKVCKNYRRCYLKIRWIETFQQCGSWERSCLRGGQALYLK